MAPPGSGDEQPVLDRTILDQMAEDVAPALVPQLIQAFMAEMRDREARMATHASQDALAAVRTEAHSLKSSAAAFGAMALSQRCTAMDVAGKAGDLDELKALAEGLGPDIAAAEEALSAYLAETGNG